MRTIKKIPTLWATLNYNARRFTTATRCILVSSDDGVLSCIAGRTGFRLVGKKEFVGTVFDIGSNGTPLLARKSCPGIESALVRHLYADLARLGSDKLPIPIRPDLVTEVLAVG